MNAVPPIRRRTPPRGPLVALACALWLASGPAPAQRSAAPPPAPAATPSVPVPIDGGPFGTVEVLPPAGGAEIRSVALFLADAGGGDLGATLMRRRLTELNALVVPVDPRGWLAAMGEGADGCADLAGDLSALARTAEAAAGVTGYIAPMLVSRAQGSPLAYAAMLQAQPDAFKGAVSVDFCPHLAASVPLCPGTALAGSPLPRGEGLALDAVAQAPFPWTVLHAKADRSCRRVDVPGFVAGIEGASYVEVPGATARYAADAALMSPFEQAYLSVAGSDSSLATAADSLPAPLRDLPLTEVVDPKAPTGDAFAIMYSGDGGWADLDAGVARRLAAAGVPTVGVSSLKYFWRARDPDGMAKDFRRIADHYAAAWKRSRVMLVGYSLGADVAPFIASRATSGPGASLAALGLLSPGREASFQFHLTDWLKAADDGAPIAPEIGRIDASMPVACAYGTSEADASLCTTDALKRPKAAVKAFDGGHHLAGDYDGIATLLLGSLSAR